MWVFCSAFTWSGEESGALKWRAQGCRKALTQPPFSKEVCVSSGLSSQSPSPKEEEMACLWNVIVGTQITYLETEGSGSPNSGLNQHSARCPTPLTWATQSPLEAPLASHPLSSPHCNRIGLSDHNSRRLELERLVRAGWLAFLAIPTS